MSLKLKTGTVNVKGKDGRYINYDLLAEQNKDQLINEITAAGNAKLNAINTEGTSAVTNIQNESSTAITSIQSEGASQKKTIEDKGAAVLESIPDEYEDLNQEVSDLKSAVNTLQPAATASDVGKALIVKTVDQTTGKPSAYEYGEAGGGGGGGSSRTLLGEVSVDSGVIIHILSIDYATGVITVDDASMLPTTNILWTDAKIRLTRLDVNAKLDTLPSELIRQNLGCTKIDDTTLYLQTGNTGNITSYTQEATHDITKWALEYNANGTQYLAIENLGMSNFPNHLVLEYCGAGASVNDSVGPIVRLADKDRAFYLDYTASNGIRPNFGTDAYSFYSYRCMPITNGTVVQSAIKGCAEPFIYTIDLVKCGKAVIVRADTTQAVCANASADILYCRDVNAEVIADNGLSHIRVQVSNGYAAHQNGSYLRLWEVHD